MSGLSDLIGKVMTFTNNGTKRIVEVASVRSDPATGSGVLSVRDGKTNEVFDVVSCALSEYRQPVPAFPRSGRDYGLCQSQEGMSLRAWFAGMIASGIRASETNPDCGTFKSHTVAQMAVADADALLAELEK